MVVRSLCLLTIVVLYSVQFISSHPHKLNVIFNENNYTYVKDQKYTCLETPEETTGIRCVSDCKGMPNDDYQSCDSCHTYTTCSNGLAYLNRPCAGRLVWDDFKKMCKYRSNTCKGLRKPVLDPEQEGFLEFNLEDFNLTSKFFNDNNMDINVIGITNFVGSDEYDYYEEDYEYPEGEEPSLHAGCKQSAGFEVKFPKCVKKIEFEYEVSKEHYGGFFIFDDINWMENDEKNLNVSAVGLSFLTEVAFVFKRDNIHDAVIFDYPYGTICGTIEPGKVTLSNDDTSIRIESDNFFSNFDNMRGITVMFNVEFFGMSFTPGGCGFKFKYSC